MDKESAYCSRAAGRGSRGEVLRELTGYMERSTLVATYSHKERNTAQNRTGRWNGTESKQKHWLTVESTKPQLECAACMTDETPAKLIRSLSYLALLWWFNPPDVLERKLKMVTTAGDIIQEKWFGRQRALSNVNKQALLAVCMLGGLSAVREGGEADIKSFLCRQFGFQNLENLTQRLSVRRIK